MSRTAETRIAEPLSELCLLCIGILPAELLAKTLLSKAARHSGHMHRRLSLLDGTDDLRQNRKKLAHHFVDILRAQLPLLIESIAEGRKRLLRLCKNLRKKWNDLPNDLTDILV